MSLNQTLYQFIARLMHRGIFFDSVLVFLSEYLMYFLVGAVLVFIVLHRNWRERWLLGFELAVAVLLSRGILTEAIRYFYHHARPFAYYHFTPLFEETANNSFPSGHMTFIWPVAVILFFYDKKWGAAYFLAGLVMGVARIASGVHWPFDIAGGITIGIFVGWAVHRLFRPRRALEQPEMIARSGN